MVKYWSLHKTQRDRVQRASGLAITGVGEDDTRREGTETSPSSLNTSLWSGHAWVISFCNKPVIYWVKCFSEFSEPLCQINPTQGGGHGNLLSVACRSEAQVPTCVSKWLLKWGWVSLLGLSPPLVESDTVTRRTVSELSWIAGCLVGVWELVVGGVGTPPSLHRRWNGWADTLFRHCSHFAVKKLTHNLGDLLEVCPKISGEAQGQSHGYLTQSPWICFKRAHPNAVGGESVV